MILSKWLFQYLLDVMFNNDNCFSFIKNRVNVYDSWKKIIQDKIISVDDNLHLWTCGKFSYD